MGSIAATMVLYARALLARFPMKFATLKDPAFSKSPESQYLFLCLMMLVSPPLPFALMPFAAYSTHALATAHQSMVAKLPAFARTRLTWLASEEGDQMTMAFVAISEVMVGVTAPL